MRTAATSKDDRDGHTGHVPKLFIAYASLIQQWYGNHLYVQWVWRCEALLTGLTADCIHCYDVTRIMTLLDVCISQLKGLPWWPMNGKSAC